MLQKNEYVKHKFKWHFSHLFAGDLHEMKNCFFQTEQLFVAASQGHICGRTVRFVVHSKQYIIRSSEMFNQRSMVVYSQYFGRTFDDVLHGSKSLVDYKKIAPAAVQIIYSSLPSNDDEQYRR